MAAPGYKDATPTSSSHSNSGTSTPVLSSSWSMPRPSAVSHAVSGLLRRFSTETSSSSSQNPHGVMHSNSYPVPKSHPNGVEGVYTPPYRTASPFQPPPLYPISLKGRNPETPVSAQLLTKALAEEIRLLVPPRLQLCEEWNLVYSLEEHGVSLGTLYKNCDDLRGLRNGFVLVVRDGEGGLFGAYLTEAPHSSPHYFGTGECFLWRASVLSSQAVLSSLPPPPSSDTTNMQRSTTIGSSLSPPSQNNNAGISTPERIRFKAFPYSGVNDYLMLCNPTFLSVGGGDGHYGLWLDDTFEKGISCHCLTFGNEPLSEEGEKFEIIGVELWSLGN